MFSSGVSALYMLSFWELPSSHLGYGISYYNIIVLVMCSGNCSYLTMSLTYRSDASNVDMLEKKSIIGKKLISYNRKETFYHMNVCMFRKTQHI